MKRLAVLIVIGFCVFESVAAAFGDMTIFDSRAAFDAATTGRTVIDFENIAPDDSWVSVPSPPGITLQSTNFVIDPSVSGDGWLFVLGKNFYFPGTSILSPQNASTGYNSVLATMPEPFTAVGMDFAGGRPESLGTITFKLSTGDTFSRLSDGQQDFFGVLSTIPITSVTMSMDNTIMGYAPSIDNFTFGTAVPEPSTLILLGIGAIGLLGYTWRRRQQAT